MAEKQPGKRLRAVIKALGLSYTEFGEKVAKAERPPRDRPYRRNNVGEWTSGRSGLKPRTWDAIEVVTGKPMRFFLYGGTAGQERATSGLPVGEDVEMPPRKGRAKKKAAE